MGVTLSVSGLRRFPTRKLLNGLGIAIRSLALALVLSALGIVPGAPIRSEATAPVEHESSQDVVETAGLRDDEIVIRMSGCPNGCSRPYLAEIGLVGRAPGRYNLYLGAAFDGSRLNKLYGKDLGHDEIVGALGNLIGAYAKERADGERFGDFVIRKGYVAATTSGADFHANLAPELDAA